METPAGHPDHWRQTLEPPGELREPLTVLAKSRERSVAGEIRVALREYVKRAELGGTGGGEHE